MFLSHLSSMASAADFNTAGSDDGTVLEISWGPWGGSEGGASGTSGSAEFGSSSPLLARWYCSRRWWEDSSGDENSRTGVPAASHSLTAFWTSKVSMGRVSTAEGSGRLELTPECRPPNYTCTWMNTCKAFDQYYNLKIGDVLGPHSPVINTHKTYSWKLVDCLLPVYSWLWLWYLVFVFLIMQIRWQWFQIEKKYLAQWSWFPKHVKRTSRSSNFNCGVSFSCGLNFNCGRNFKRWLALHFCQLCLLSTQPCVWHA